MARKDKNYFIQPYKTVKAIFPVIESFVKLFKDTKKWSLIRSIKE